MTQHCVSSCSIKVMQHSAASETAYTKKLHRSFRNKWYCGKWEINYYHAHDIEYCQLNAWYIELGQLLCWCKWMKTLSRSDMLQRNTPVYTRQPPVKEAWLFSGGIAVSIPKRRARARTRGAACRILYLEYIEDNKFQPPVACTKSRVVLLAGWEWETVRESKPHFLSP